MDLEKLDGTTIGRAAALIAAEHASARGARPELPESYVDADGCAAELHRLVDNGHRGIVALHHGRAVAVMTAIVRDVAAVGRYARLPAEGLAVDPALADPTAALGAVYAELAPALIADGARRHYLLHVAAPTLSEALSNLGFGRDGVYAVRPTGPSTAGGPGPAAGVDVRVAGSADLDAVARMALVEIRYRVTPPMFAAPHDPPLGDLIAEHRALRDNGAVHLVASVDGRDAGLLTIEPTGPVPRLCPAGEPYIGSTATLPEARRRGVGRVLVGAAADWAHRRGHRWLGVDFASANPVSRPFWLGAGFRPTGYGLMRFIDPEYRYD
jgi:GNAT superfamily N-acetyltransferase